MIPAQLAIAVAEESMYGELDGAVG